MVAGSRVLNHLHALARGVRRVARDPRTHDLAAAGPRTAVFLAGVWARNRRDEVDAAAAAAARLSPALAAQVLIDNALIAALKDPRLLPRHDDYGRSAEEIAYADDLYRREGWLDDPVSYHRDPPRPLAPVRLRASTPKPNGARSQTAQRAQPRACEPPPSAFQLRAASRRMAYVSV